MALHLWLKEFPNALSVYNAVLATIQKQPKGMKSPVSPCKTMLPTRQASHHPAHKSPKNLRNRGAFLQNYGIWLLQNLG
jgi:hypothetical protein